MTVLYSNMKPGDSKFVYQERVVLVEAYDQRDEPPGRGNVGLRHTLIAESEEVINPSGVAAAVKRVAHQT